MLNAGPFPPIWVYPDAVSPLLAVAFYGFMAGLPALLKWLLDLHR